MMKMTRLRNFVILISCLYSLPSFANSEDLSPLIKISIPQHFSTMGEDDGSTGNLRFDNNVVPEGSEIEIGKVKDFILDLDAGRVAYIVGVFDHLPQWKDKLFVIPWERVRLAPEMENFAFVGDEATLEKTPHFSSAAWRTQSLSLGTLLADKYGKERAGLSTGRVYSPQSTYSKASDLVGLNVQSTTGKKWGTIEAFLLTPGTGEISYLLLSSETEQTESDKKFFTLPWYVLQASAKQHFLHTERGRTKLSQRQKILCDNTNNDHSVDHCQQEQLRMQTLAR